MVTLVNKKTTLYLIKFNASDIYIFMVEKNSYTYKLTADQQNILCGILNAGNYRPAQVPFTKIAVKTNDCNINLYTSGKCLVQGKGAREFVEFILEPTVLQTIGVGYEDFLNPEASKPHMGVDESGKGDFFGPMVTAAAYIDEDLINAMREMGVTDSKNITSDKKAKFLGSELRKLLGKRYAIIRIGPAAYNRLYAKMRSVNTLLAWAHARAIENLLEIVPDCPRAISDQFGNKSQVKNALMKKGSKVELVQRHKAEEDMAVAAASIIAREAFLRALTKMADQYRMEIPKGASTAVKDTAAKLIENNTPDILIQTAKCHFKTTDAVLESMGLDRNALSSEGQVKSKAYKYNKFKKKA